MNWPFSIMIVSVAKHHYTYMEDPVPMSPLLAARNNCELVMSFSDCLIDWGVDWWSGKGCLCVALLLGSGRVDTVVGGGGCVCVLWASCEVLTALGGSGSLPITEPEPDAANKILLVIKCRPLSLWIFFSRKYVFFKFYPEYSPRLRKLEYWVVVSLNFDASFESRGLLYWKLSYIEYNKTTGKYRFENYTYLQL